MTKGKAGSSKHILVVNDTEEILDLFRDILEGMGHEMSALSYAPDDLAQVTAAGPDMVILDLVFGSSEAQGWQLLQKIRMNKATEDLPVLVCTAATSEVRDQEGWLAANGVKVLLKPFKVAEFERAVKKALTLHDLVAPTSNDGADAADARRASPSA